MPQNKQCSCKPANFHNISVNKYSKTDKVDISSTATCNFYMACSP
jgi:hypothetical protein